MREGCMARSLHRTWRWWRLGSGCCLLPRGRPGRLRRTRLRKSFRDALPAPEGSARAITPYTAPEVVQGRPADARSDIFGFGAILFEMFTGRQAFDGETRATLAANLTKAPTPASGSAGVDRLLRKCLSKNPEMRSSRMQKIILELKLLSVAVRRVDQATGAALTRDTAEDSEAARPDMQELEARLAARLQVQERTIAEMHRSANEAVSSLRLKVAAMNSELATTHQYAANRTGAGLDDAAAETIHARGDRGVEARRSGEALGLKN